MTPLFFGTGARRLFGIYEPGRSGSRAPRAAVLCYPWGQEYIRAHRSMRRLANMLAATGRDALRFDYFGTGDSAGDMIDADLAGWESDIETAMDEVKDTSGAPRVALLGLRLGGALAARVAVKRQKDVEALVLWDPVISGRQYLQELHSMETSIALTPPAQRPSESGGGHEILGFPLTTAMAAEIEALDLLSIVPGLPNRTLTIGSRPSLSYDDLASALRQRPDNPPVIENILYPPAWLEDRDTGAGAIPVKALQRIIQWLA
jgi:uncharacterized protein